MEQPESTRKSRIIRRATVIFFTGMAVLTLFSNTIVNYSLPRVQVKNFESGIIYRQIQADGTVAAKLQHTINFGAARTVDQVRVEVGTPVLVGDVIATLKPTDGLELLEMEKALENAELAFAQLKETPPSLMVPNQEKAVLAAEKAIVTALKNITAREKDLADARENHEESYEALIKAERDAEDDLEDREDELDAAEAELAAVLADPASTPEAIGLAQDAVETAENAVESAEDTLQDAQEASNAGASDDSIVAAEESLAAAKEAHTESITALEDARQALAAAIKSDALTVKNHARDITRAENDLIIQRKKFASFKATASINEIKSDYEGRISKLSVTAGTAINPSEAIATIDDAGAAYELRASLAADQAKTLVLGDRADVMMGSVGWAQGILREIRDDKDQPGAIKQLVFDVEGDVTLGQQVTISLYKQSRNYEMIVPNAAVRQDANGSFILAMRSKSGPLGSRYTLERIEISVLETDNSRTAISGTLEFGVPIVTAANKPVETGSRVLPTQ